MTEAAARALELSERGFTVLPSLWDEARSLALSAEVSRVWKTLGEPPLFREPDLEIADDANVSAVGFTLFRLLERIRGAEAFLLEPQLLELISTCLGPVPVLEQVSAVMTDERRPFFFWHNHLGGIDGVDHRGRHRDGLQRFERLVCTLYTCPLDDAHGTMLVEPRCLSAATDPPHPEGRERWPSAVEVRAPLGSVVVLDQATWHAVTPMSAAGRRSFAAFFVRRSDVVARRHDPSIERALLGDPALSAHYRAQSS